MKIGHLKDKIESAGDDDLPDGMYLMAAVIIKEEKKETDDGSKYTCADITFRIKNGDHAGKTHNEFLCLTHSDVTRKGWVLKSRSTLKKLCDATLGRIPDDLDEICDCNFMAEIVNSTDHKDAAKRYTNIVAFAKAISKPSIQDVVNDPTLQAVADTFKGDTFKGKVEIDEIPF